MKQENSNPIIYVTRDIERALGMMPNKHFHIITNHTPYSEIIKKQHPEHLHLVDSDRGILSTADLIRSNVFLKTADEIHGDILTFKNNVEMETLVKERGLHLLNPSAALSEKVENKVTQIDWLGHMAQDFLPSTVILKTADIKWSGEAIVIQWAHGHTGEGTVLVNSEKDLTELKNKFKDRVARVSRFINGPSFTVNVAVGANKICMANVSYQITGIAPFTDNRFSTVGNDWSLTHSLLREEEINYIDKIAHEIGGKMRDSGWRGLFGIDLMKDLELNKIFLIEINARQPASTTFESNLQLANRNNGLTGITTFEAHLNTLCMIESDKDLIVVNDGAQIIQRVTNSITEIDEEVKGSLELAGYRAIPYANTKYNSDLLRIQCNKGIMESHGKLNTRGKEIADILVNA